MAERDWEKELAAIDRQIAAVPDERVAPAASPRASAVSVGASRAAAPPAAPVRGARAWVIWVQLGLTLAAAASLWVWPWPARCGAPLIGFVAAATGVAVMGCWTAVGTWRHRLGVAHTIALLVVVWGLVLAGRDVLPRVGYAVPTTEHGAQWSCTVQDVTSEAEASA